MNNDLKYSHRYLGAGVAVSNDTRLTHRNNNDLIVGGSGAGKSGSIVYPQLKSLQDSSLIVADTKGRLAGMFREELKQRGYKVRVLDFVKPENSCVYNPLSYIKFGKNGCREQDVAKIAMALIPTNLHGHDPFWAMSARTVMEFLISYTLLALPKEDHTMYTVSKLFRMLMTPMGEAAFHPWVDNNSDTLAGKRYEQIKAWKSADKMLSSIYSFVNVGLKSFDYEEYRNVFDPYFFTKTKNAGTKKRTEVDIASIGREKTVLFLNVSDSDHSMDEVVNLFYTQALQTLMTEADSNEDGQLKVPVRIIMDDFASSALIPDFDKLISVVRSRDIWLSLCVQSLTQLETLYSHSQAVTIMNNCDHIIYLGGNDLSSAEYIGTRAKRTPETILEMDRTKEYILEAGHTVQLVNKIPPYQFAE